MKRCFLKGVVASKAYKWYHVRVLILRKNTALQMRRQVFSTTLSISLIAFLLVLPDFIFSFFNESFKHSSDPRVLFIILPLSIGLAINKYKSVSIFLICVFSFLQVIQFAHIAYFGNQMSPYSLHILTHEIEDVLTESGNMIFRYIYVIPTVILPFLGILFCLSKIKSSKSVLGTVILGAIFYYCYTKYYNNERLELNTNESRFTIGNSIKAIVGYGILETHTFESKEYLPYEVTDISTDEALNEPVTIVYIIGESCNYNHMSLFGYERETTPRLSELAKMENFYFTKGISSGVATFAASKFMLNAIREPDNIKQSSKNNTNLFKLAKQHGFKTFYLSSQTSHLLSGISGFNCIDVAITRGLHFTDSRTLKDEYLFKLLSKQKFGERNFIVMHQACIHAPYVTVIGKNFADRKKFKGSKNKLIDEYDNAMFYNDFLISKMFGIFNKSQKGKFYIIFASDHNEALGENGHFGHTLLFPEIANIPVIVQSNDHSFIEEIKQIFLPNHYEIAKKIAEIIGYKINNPNELKDSFYICGVDPSGKCGYIPYTKDKEKKLVKYEKKFG